MFVVPANWPTPRIAHWRALLIARAIENQAYVLGVNRVGKDPTPLEYPGASLAVDPQGNVLAEAGAEECVLSVDIDPGEVRSWRERFPAWREAPGVGG
jgi:predicted amidohydrolase